MAKEHLLKEVLESGKIPMKEKLCTEGLKLFEEYCLSGERNDYSAYLNHVRSCQNCFKKEREITE